MGALAASRGPVKSSKLFPVEMTASFRSTSGLFSFSNTLGMLLCSSQLAIRVYPFVPFVAKVLLRALFLLERHIAILDIANAEGAKSNALYS